jgi:hypothetical protein
MSTSISAWRGAISSQDWSNTGLITTDDNWSNRAQHRRLPWRRPHHARRDGPDDPDRRRATRIDVIANQTNPDTFATAGVAEFQIANPTIACNGSGTADAPYIVLYPGRRAQNLAPRLDLRDLDASTTTPTSSQHPVPVGASGAWTN